MPIKFPKTPAAAIDLVWSLSEQRKALERQADEIKEQEKAIKALILDMFARAGGVESMSGKLALASLSHLTVPKPADWSQIWAHVKKTGDFELLHKRISVEAWRERVNAGKSVPGVEAVQVTELRIGVKK